MPGNFVRPPTSSGSGEEIDVIGVCEAAGWPEDHISRETIAQYVMPCIESTFSDGELVVKHPVEQDPLMREFFGETTFDEGVFGTRLRELLDGEDLEIRGKVDNLIRCSATLFAKHVVTGTVALPNTQNVRINRNPTMQNAFWIDPLLRLDLPTLGFDHREITLPHYPEVVVDYGPGVQGRHRIEDQIRDIATGHMPYSHFALSKGPFVNEFLMRYWAARYKDPSVLSQVLGKLYIGREDGIASASTEMVRIQQERTGTSEMADVVLASGIHAAGHEEVATGITNAYKLLKPNGVLLVRAPKDAVEAKPGSVRAQEMIDTALSAGFERSRATFFDVITGDATKPGVKSTTAVFCK